MVSMLDHKEFVSVVMDDSFENILVFVFSSPAEYTDKLFPALYVAQHIVS